ncbi:MAG TPA: hypothetical protein VGD64_00630 [Acidisarcina sp.]
MVEQLHADGHLRADCTEGVLKPSDNTLRLYHDGAGELWRRQVLTPRSKTAQQIPGRYNQAVIQMVLKVRLTPPERRQDHETRVRVKTL